MIFNVGAGGGASTADKVKYNNTESGLQSDNVQGAVDELNNSLNKINNLSTNKKSLSNVTGALIYCIIGKIAICTVSINSSVSGTSIDICALPFKYTGSTMMLGLSGYSHTAEAQVRNSHIYLNSTKAGESVSGTFIVEVSE